MHEMYNETHMFFGSLSIFFTATSALLCESFSLSPGEGTNKVDFRSPKGEGGKLALGDGLAQGH